MGQHATWEKRRIRPNISITNVPHFFIFSVIAFCNQKTSSSPHQCCWILRISLMKFIIRESLLAASYWVNCMQFHRYLDQRLCWLMTSFQPWKIYLIKFPTSNISNIFLWRRIHTPSKGLILSKPLTILISVYRPHLKRFQYLCKRLDHLFIVSKAFFMSVNTSYCPVFGFLQPIT